MAVRLAKLQRRRKRLQAELDTFNAVRAWNAALTERLDVQIGQLEAASEREQHGPIDPDFPPCPVCDSEIKKAHWLRLNYGMLFKPCGCELSVEAWQTRLARRCASGGVLLLVISSIIGLLVGSPADAAVSAGIATSFGLVGVSIVALLLPREHVRRRR